MASKADPLPIFAHRAFKDAGIAYADRPQTYGDLTAQDINKLKAQGLQDGQIDHLMRYRTLEPDAPSVIEETAPNQVADDGGVMSGLFETIVPALSQIPGVGPLLSMTGDIIEIRDKLANDENVGMLGKAFAGIPKGVTLGLNEEISAIPALRNGVSGYLEELATLRDREKRIKKNAGGAYTVGEAVGAMAGGGALTSAVLGGFRLIGAGSALSVGAKYTLGRAGVASSTAALEAGVYASTEAESLEEAQQIIGYAALGGAVGQLVLGEGLRFAAKKFGGKRPMDQIFVEIGQDFDMALRRELQIPQGEAIPEDLLLNRLAALGPEATVLDLLPDMKNAAKQLSTMTDISDAAVALRQIVKQRSSLPFMEKAFEDIAETLGKPMSPMEFEQGARSAIEGLQKQYSGLMAKGDALGLTVNPNAITTLLDDVIKSRNLSTTEMQRVRDMVRSNVKRLVKENITNKRFPKGTKALRMSDLQSLRVQLGDYMPNPGNASTDAFKKTGVAVAAEFRKQLGELIEGQFPEFANYNKAYSSVENHRAAYAIATQALTQPGITEKGVVSLLEGLDVPHKDVAYGLFNGLAYNLRTRAMDTTGNLPELAGEFSNSLLRNKNARLLLGDNTAEAFFNTINKYSDMQKSVMGLADASPASTYVRSPENPLAGLVDVGTLAAAGGGGASTAAGLGALRRSVAGAKGKGASASNAALAQILAQNAGEGVNTLSLLRDLAKRGPESAVDQAAQVGSRAGVAGMLLGDE